MVIWQLARTNYNEALSAFERAASVQPDHTGLRLEIANVLRLLGRLWDAELVLRALMKSGNELAIIRLSHLLMDTNRLDEAETVLANALEKDTNNARVQPPEGTSRDGAAIAPRHASFLSQPANSPPATSIYAWTLPRKCGSKATWTAPYCIFNRS